MFFSNHNATEPKQIGIEASWRGEGSNFLDALGIERLPQIKHLFCTNMGKSSTLHCEVQLLDDQSTVLDLDVSFLSRFWWYMYCCFELVAVLSD